PCGSFGGHFDNHKIEASRTGGTWADKYGSKVRHWDAAPPPEYFYELFRVSKNQIIWGGNYFALPPTRCFVIWRKLTISENFSMAMCEYAWSSFNMNAKIFECVPQGSSGEKRFHPTQKPVALYQWLLRRFAKPGDKIIDTHAGSASSLIACHGAGYEYIGFELDNDYYRMAKERLNNAKRQLDLFNADNS
ncbi:MAG: site-specific DNA-methyltransferase, partial [Chitinispirillales bacterium]|nr:site-specific DNA-methyltransferase [Chitinispirillales bacterium]